MFFLASNNLNCGCAICMHCVPCSLDTSLACLLLFEAYRAVQGTPAKKAFNSMKLAVDPEMAEAMANNLVCATDGTHGGTSLNEVGHGALERGVPRHCGSSFEARLGHVQVETVNHNRALHFLCMQSHTANVRQ